MESYLVPLRTPCVYYDPDFLTPDESKKYYDTLLNETCWQKTPKINRWVSLHSDTPSDYRYRDAPPPPPPPPPQSTLQTTTEESSDTTTTSKDIDTSKSPTSAPSSSSSPTTTTQPYTPTLSLLATKASSWYHQHNPSLPPPNFNICLLNFYENGSQRIGWHSDREEIGRTTPIASLSLGATRTFQLRAKIDGAVDRASVDVADGSLLIMEAVCQREYVHSLPKMGDVREGRINVTFRCKGGEGETTGGEGEHRRRDDWLDKIGTVGVGGGGIVRGDDAVLFGRGVAFGEIPVGYTMRYTVTTNIGTEKYLAAEIMELLGVAYDEEDDDDEEEWRIIARPFGIAGYVGCCHRDGQDEEESDLTTTTSSSSSTVVATLLELRSAHNLMEYHHHFHLNDVMTWMMSHDHDKSNHNDNNSSSISNISSISGDNLYSYYKSQLVSSHYTLPPLSSPPSSHSHTTFRVTSERIGGPHSFKSSHVEREMGGALSEHYSTTSLPRMTDYDHNIRVDVVHDTIVVGVQLNVDDLSKGVRRHFLRFRNAVTIKTNIAYDMLRCGNVKRGDVLVDPFCGSGTILMEAMEAIPGLKRVVGMDVSRRSANGARENAIARGYVHNGNDDDATTTICEFHCLDARALRKHLADDSVDAMITNLPWGVMTGHKNVHDLQSLYEIFLRTAWYTMKTGGRIVMLVLRGLQLVRLVRKLGGRYKLLDVTVVRTGNNLPSLVVVEKVAVDEEREAVKRQLAYMAPFVNVSAEMYEAIHYEKIDEVDNVDVH